MMQKLGIPQPESGMAHNLEEAIAIAERIGYPLMVRPSYVLGGRGMEVVHDREDLTLYVSRAVEIWPDLPILIDKFLENALEVRSRRHFGRHRRIHSRHHGAHRTGRDSLGRLRLRSAFRQHSRKAPEND